MKAPTGGYHMWYGSTVDWTSSNGEMIHVFKYASSSDGDVWNRHGLAVPYEVGIAQAFSRPTVRFSPQCGYEMWFSYRGGSGTTYRIGYAQSDDGQHFKLNLANAGIDVSTSGWDS